MTNEKPHKRRIEPEMLVGVSAVLIGMCALGVSFYETSLMREEQRAAVIPILELARSYSLKNIDIPNAQWRLTLHAENVGIGPARVMDFRVTVDGQPKPTWEAAMQALINRDAPVGYGQSTINGRTIPPDRSVTMFSLNDKGLAKEISDQFDRLEFSACFCSVFDECWTTSYSTFGAAMPVRQCQRTDSSFQE